MIAIPYLITLDQPLLASEIGNDPNSSRSQPYIPGGMVRGLLAGRCLVRTPTADASADPIFRRLVLDGSVRVLHAYPVSTRTARALPTFASLAVGKDNSTRLYDTAHPEFDRASAEAEAGALRALGAPFMYEREEVAPEFTVTVHIERDRAKGRSLEPTKDGKRRGEIFRYEALAAGQRFKGAILAETQEDAALVRELLRSAAVRLGRSRNAGYGAAQLELDADDSTWREHPSALRTVAPDTTVRLVFLSDALLETADGQPLTVLDDAAVSDLLGTPVTVHPKRSFTAATTVAGFNRTWQLPLPQTPAIAAGSVVTLSVPAGLSGASIARLTERGVGLRRAEGYGRVTLLAEPDETDGSIATPDSRRLTVPPVTGLAHAFAETLAQRRAAVRIDAGIADYARNHGITRKETISAAQLGGFSALVRQAQVQHQTGIDALKTHLKNLRKNAHDQFTQTLMTDDRVPLLTWLQELLDNPGRVWNYVQAANWQSQIQIAGSNYDPTKDAGLTHDTALRLIVAVLAEARRQSKRKGEQE